MPGERRAQVLLDVEGQGPQRRQVEEPGAVAARSGGSRGDEPVDAPQERGQRLARAGGRADQGVRPTAMAGQPWAWAAVGSGNVDANHSRTAGENRSRATARTLPRGCRQSFAAGSPGAGNRGAGRPDAAGRLRAMVTGEYHPAFEEYCECIFELDEDDVDVIQARIADRLQVSRPAVSEMMKRLETEGLVSTATGRILLSSRGLELAERVVRRHRLAERFLTDILGLSWADAHKEAGRWEHVMSDVGRGRHEPRPRRADDVPARQPDPRLHLRGAGRAAAGRRSLVGHRVHRVAHPRGAGVHARPARLPGGVGHPAGALRRR